MQLYTCTSTNSALIVSLHIFHLLHHAFRCKLLKILFASLALHHVAISIEPPELICGG